MMRTEKAGKIKNLEEVLRSAKGIYIADFRGMTVEVISELRKKCRESGVRFEVTKNTLLRRAAKATGNEAILPFVDGPTAMATSVEDEVAPARVLVDFLKQFKAPQLKGGVIDGKALDEAQIKVVSWLPTKDVLLGHLMRTLQSPLSNLASALAAPLRDLVGVLNEVAKKKEAA